MNNEELNDKLKELDIEDFIWIIYIGIILLSWYSNSLERDFYINNNEESKDKYRKIIILIFTILTIVYFYFFQDSLEDITSLNENDPVKKKELITLSFIGSTLVLISGIIFLYIAIKDEDLNVELAFN